MILSGILLTPTGLPYKNSSVRITANNTSEQVLMFVTKDFKTGEDGSYEIDVPNGWYHVSVFSLEYRSYANIGNIEVTDLTTQTTINELLMLDQTAHSDGLAAQVAADAASALASKNAAAVSATNSANSASASANSAVASANSATASQTSATNSQTSAVSSASSAAASQASADLTASLLSTKTDKSVSLLSWSYASSFQLASATRDANEAIITANIVWPDGITGVFTTDVASTAFPGAIDAWHATYTGSPNKLITQPVVTRDAAGAVISQPAITVV
jgi:uncharacterized membrane protein